MGTSLLEKSKAQLLEIVTRNRLLDAHVSVLVRTLTPEEAIGKPQRREFPLVLGKERLVEAELLGTRAHAFTDFPKEFRGSLKEVLNLPLASNGDRSIYVATLNAILRYLNLIEKTIHCKDEDPERCGKEVVLHILKKWGPAKVGFIGLNPAIAESLVNTFGAQNVRITDLNKEQIHSCKYGVEVWDGHELTEKLIEDSDVVLVTGTTFVNGTFNHILHCIQRDRKEYAIYGVTGAGMCELMGLNRICPYSRSDPM